MSLPIENSKKNFLVKIHDVHKRICLDEVYCLKSEGKYVSLILETRNYSFRGTLKTLEQVLPEKFIRVHSSYIVNIDKIKVIKSQENIIVLENDFELNFSRKNKDDLFAKFLLG